MARQKRNPAAHELIKQMMAMYKPETMEDVHDMLKDMFSDTLEEMLHAELDAALGYEKHDQSPKQTTNRRNGSYPKTVRGELGETVIDIPRDRDGEYEPVAIRPIINGTGNYYIESRTRNDERMDVVIDYLGERFVVELKIWRGQSYHDKGEVQLANYLEYYHLDKGYMLTYNFNQKKNSGLTSKVVNGKTLIEAFV